MQALSRTIAALVLGAACALPAFAQGTGHPNPGTGKPSPQQAMPSGQPGATATPASQPGAPSADTRSMGAGPAMDEGPAGDGHRRDLGWLGLLGLVGLLGLRGRHDDHHDDSTHAARRPRTDY